MSKKSSCIYCGQNPVPHFLYWYNESVNIALTPLRQRILYNPLSPWLKGNLSQPIFKLFLGFFQALGMLKQNADATKCTVRRAQVLWEEATRRNIKMSEYLLFGKNIDMYRAEGEISNIKFQISNGTNKVTKIIFSGLPRPLNYYNAKLDILDDKALFKKLMMEKKLPVPRGGAATSWDEARKIFNGINKPAIVKPRSGSRGRHSTTFVYDEAELKQAFKVAKQLCYWVMVEEQLFGPVYRATVINFKIQGVLRGDPPQIVGDGTQTIQELVTKKNHLPHPGVENIIIDDRSKIFLSRQNLTVESVVPSGQQVDLSEKIGVRYGGSSSEDFNICHPDNKDLFERAATALGDPIVGFDFIIPKIEKSWKTQKCGFIEVNTLPFINLHHDPLHGQPRNVAAAVWDMMEM